MSAIDKFIDELRRSGDTSLILLSESEPRFRGKDGERGLEGKVSHKEVTALVEEIVPPECFADLVMMEPVEFPFSHEAGELAIRVVPGPSIWRVVVDVRGDGLAPLSAADSAEDESPSQTWQGLGSGPREAPPPDGEASPSGSSRSEIEPVGGPEGGDTVAEPEGRDEGEPATAPRKRTVSKNPLDAALDEAAEASTGADNEIPLSEALLADQGDLLDDDDDDDDDDDGDIDLTSFMPSAEEGPMAESADGSAATAVDVYASPTPPAPLDQDQRSTKQLQDQASGAEPADAELADADADFAPPPSAPAEAPAPVRPVDVQPLEYDFDEAAEPQHAIEGLDPLLDAAWKQGATTLLLRDDHAPLMARGAEVSELPFGKPEQGRLTHDLVDIVASPSQAEQLGIMGQCRFVYLTGSSTRVRCTMVQDGGALAASIRRIGDEHLADNAQRWMSDTVRELLPPHGLVLVCGAPGHGKTTTAAALAAMAHEHHSQVVVVANPLERRLESEGAGMLQRRIPEDVPNCAQALQDAHLLEAPLVLVDVPRPDKEALAMLSLAAQGRVVIATWPAPDCVEAIQSLMDALPAELAPAERARRGRNLVGVIAVKLVPAAGSGGGVLPLFEVLRTNPALLGAVAESRLDALRGTEIRQITFESSRALLVDRGLL